MPYEYAFSADLPFKIVVAVSGLVLYAKGGVVAVGPEIPGSGYLWKVNPENEGVYNVESGLYIQADGKLAASPQAWDLIGVGSGNYNIKIKGVDKAVNIAGDLAIAADLNVGGISIGAGVQAFKIVQA